MIKFFSSISVYFIVFTHLLSAHIHLETILPGGCVRTEHEIIQKQGLYLMGIACKVSPQQLDDHNTANLWEKFWSEDVFHQIPHKISEEVIGLYCNYEGDHTDPYTFFIGCPVSNIDKIPEGLVGQIIPTSTYAVFQVTGNYPASLTHTWEKIYSLPFKRTYTGDFEVYSQAFIQGQSTNMSVYIALEDASKLSSEKIQSINKQKFSTLKQLELPYDHYVIINQGPLAIRNLKTIETIEILVSADLWKNLSTTCEMNIDKGIAKLHLSQDVIAMFEGSYGQNTDNRNHSLTDLISTAEMIEELPFVTLENLLQDNHLNLDDQFLIQQWLRQNSCYECRALVNNIASVDLKLKEYEALFKGEYAFRDFIYHPKNKTFDLNQEFLRLRVYSLTQWKQKPVELVHKIKNKKPGCTGKTKLKIQFNSIDEAEASSILKDYELAFSFYRKGKEYYFKGLKIYVEEVEGMLPSIEVLSDSKQDIIKFLESLNPIQILEDSIPRAIEKLIST